MRTWVLARRRARVATAESSQSLDSECSVKWHQRSVNAFSGFHFGMYFFFVVVVVVLAAHTYSCCRLHFGRGFFIGFTS